MYFKNVFGIKHVQGLKRSYISWASLAKSHAMVETSKGGDEKSTGQTRRSQSKWKHNHETGK